MWIKLVGGAILLLSGLGTAGVLCRYKRRRLRTLDGILSLLFFIKGQVDCYARPIREILVELPPEVARDCNCPQGALSLEEIVSQCRIYLDEEGLRLLECFAAEFGSSFREEQVRRCEHYIVSLRERRERLESRLRAENRVTGTLCVCASLCLMILLW